MKNVFMISLVTALSLPSAVHSGDPHAGRRQDLRQPPPLATKLSAISGRVTETGTNRPMWRVAVSCVSDRGSSSEVITGADGQYEFDGLSPGRYELSARRAGYLGSPARAKTFSPHPIPIDVAAGEVVEDINFKLVRAGAISGRIVDEFGDPVVQARVTARRRVFTDGNKRAEAAAAADTDDLGEFRLSDLVPGGYVVEAVYPSAAAKALRLRASSPERLVFWAYYPGVPTAAQGRRIEVREGRDVTSVDFALAGHLPATVTGTVRDIRGQPNNDALAIVGDAGGTGGFAGVIGTFGRAPDGSVVVDAAVKGYTAAVRTLNGRFEFSPVWPGEYVVGAYGRIGSSRPTEFAAEYVAVGGEDVAGVDLVTIGGAGALRGRIRFDEEGPRPANKPLRVRLLSGQNDDLIDRLVNKLGLPASGSVDTDWTFEVPRPPGRRLVQVSGLPTDWTVRAVTVGARTTTDALVEIQPAGTAPDLTIHLTKHPTEISGTVIGLDEAPVADYAVVVFASNRALLPFAPRFVQLGRPNQHGRFRIRALAPGEFLIAAVEQVDGGEWHDPEYLERLRPLATRVAATEGSATSITLRLIAEDSP